MKTEIKYRYSRDGLGCRCITGNCARYNSKLCNINYRDTVKEIEAIEIKKEFTTTGVIVYKDGVRLRKKVRHLHS